MAHLPTKTLCFSTAAAALLGLVLSAPGRAHPLPPTVRACAPARVIDGDTIKCGAIRVRLLGIDAPEFSGHCQPGRH